MPEVIGWGRPRSLAGLLLLEASAMLRITEQQPDRDRPATLVVEGRLAGPWVAELSKSAAPHRPDLALDLAGISYADDAGVALLNQLVAAGAQIVRTTAYVATLLGRAS